MYIYVEIYTLPHLSTSFLSPCAARFPFGGTAIRSLTSSPAFREGHVQRFALELLAVQLLDGFGGPLHAGHHHEAHATVLPRFLITPQNDLAEMWFLLNPRPKKKERTKGIQGDPRGIIPLEDGI